MEEKKPAPEAAKTAPAPEKESCKNNDRHTFVIALLTSIIVVGIYHFGMGVYKIYFPHHEDDFYCEASIEEAVEGEQPDAGCAPKGHFKGKKPGKPHKFDKDGKPHKFDKDGKPHKFGKDGKPHKFDKDGKPRKFGKGKKPAPENADAAAPQKADGQAAEKAAEKAEK